MSLLDRSYCNGTALRALLLLPLLAAMATAGEPTDEAMIELAWDSGCFNCHDLETRVRGPAWLEVAERYRGEEDALEILVERVINGSAGNWGDDAMSPNRRVPEKDVRALVQWLLTLE